MRRTIGFALWLGLAALLLAPGASFAQLDPERINGTFDFVDRDEGGNNTLEFQIDGREIGVLGAVAANAGTELVTITYSADFPSQLSANAKNASLKQDRQVLVTLEVFDMGTPVYSGQAAPIKCKVQAKLKDSAGDLQPDAPHRADATLSCDLGSDFEELTPSAPSGDVLETIEAAFEPRKDVKVTTRKGKLQIKHRGEPAP